MSKILKYSKKAQELLGELQASLTGLTKEEALLDNLISTESDLVIAQEISQKLGQVAQEQAHKRIASVVSKCLETVFDDPYIFKIIFERKHSKTAARLVFEDSEGNELDPLTAAGGGVVDVASFALRLSCLLLATPRLRKVLILDESFKFVSKNYLPRVKQMIEKLSSDLGVQFIMVTHLSELESGNIINL